MPRCVMWPDLIIICQVMATWILQDLYNCTLINLSRNRPKAFCIESDELLIYHDFGLFFNKSKELSISPLSDLLAIKFVISRGCPWLRNQSSKSSIFHGYFPQSDFNPSDVFLPDTIMHLGHVVIVLYWKWMIWFRTELGSGNILTRKGPPTKMNGKKFAQYTFKYIFQDAMYRSNSIFTVFIPEAPTVNESSSGQIEQGQAII